MTILLVEDDEILADQIAKLLNKEQYRCDVSYSLDDATHRYSEGIYQLLLIDWNLPDGSGLTLLEQIRADDDSVAIIMLSGRESIEERVLALDSGADDYLCKPYSNIELLARIRTVLRRESSMRSSALVVGDVKIDLAKRRISVKGKAIALTNREFNLLEILAIHKDQTLSRYQLSELLESDFDSITSSNVIDAHIKNLRKKLSPANIITTIRGVGYTLNS